MTNDYCFIHGKPPLLLSLLFGANVQCNGVEAFLYCQLEGAVGDETVTLASQQSTDIFF